MTTYSESSVFPQKTALVLPGGGSRAAYQVGVLKAISELLPVRAASPFPILVGTSAGAINATELAIHAHRFRVAVGNLDRVWRNFSVPQVFDASTPTMLKDGMHWLLALISAGWLVTPPPSLFDNSPLRTLLSNNFNFSCIDRSIQRGHLDALAISGAAYNGSRSMFFYQSKSDRQPWVRARHAGAPAQIDLDHLMASVAVPFLFPPVKIGGTAFGDGFYGDGSMRQSTPFSPAIHLGAERILVIATRNKDRPPSGEPKQSPSFGQIFGYMLDALFSDGLYADLERLIQINNIVRKSGPIEVEGRVMKPTEVLLIMPSRDISAIARKHVQSLPRSLRVLLRSMGALNAGGSDLMSYLMFESSFTRELIDLGYQDAMSQRSKVLDFIHGKDHSIATDAATLLY